MKVRACQDCGAHAVTGKGRRLCEECRPPKPKICIRDCGTQVNFWGTRCRSCADDHNRTCMAAYMREHRVHVKSYATIYSHLVKRATASWGDRPRILAHRGVRQVGLPCGRGYARWASWRGSGPAARRVRRM